MPPELIMLALEDPSNLEEKWTDIIRVGDWSNSYKEFEITLEDMSHMIQNFNLNVLNNSEKELQFNYSHQSYQEAAGWIEELRLQGNVLQAKVRWTKKARERIADEQFKYVSAELDLSYRDEESGEKFGITLTGAALTNIPFVRGMKAVALSNDSQKSENIFLLSKENNHMKKFKQLLSDLAAKTELSALEFAGAAGAHAMLSEEDQASTQAELDNLKGNVAEDTTAVALAEANTKIASLEASQEQGGNVELSDLQKKLSAAEGTIAEMQKATRTKDLDAKLDSLVESGKLLSKSRDDMAKNLMDLSVEQQDSMLKILDGQDPVVPVGKEDGAGGDVETGDEVDEAKDQEEAKALMALDPSLKLSDALAQVYRKRSLASQK